MGNSSRRHRAKSGWRIALLSSVVVGSVLVVFAGEIVWAVNAPRLPERDPFELNQVGSAKRTVWLGDSTAAGVGATSPGNALPRLLAEPNDQVLSLAVSGARIADVVANQLPEVPTDAERIYISIGANDTTGLTRDKDFERRYRELLRGLPTDADVVILGVPDMGSPPRFLQPLSWVAAWRGRQLDEIARRCADASGAKYIDIAGKTGPSFRKHPDQYFADDNFHPNDDGYELWAKAIRGS